MPAGMAARSGNHNTAVRWARLLRELGHDVSVQVSWNGRPADLMVALHARRSHDSIARFASSYPSRPLVLALTGTDLYRDIRSDADAKRSLRLATRIIVLQEMGLNELTPDLRRITRVIYQSTRLIRRVPPLKSCFEVCISGHLREEKDPFRLAAALKYLPRQSRVRVTHLGAAMSTAMAASAHGWMEREPRYRWVGELLHYRALTLLARSRLMVISSRMEGGANVVTEALAARVPVIASRIPGNVGMLGKDYAGYYKFGNERALARLLWRAESDPDFYRRLKSQCEARRPLVSRTREKLRLKQLLAELD